MYTINLRKNSIIPTILADKLIISLIFIFFFDFVLFPAPILADTAEYGSQIITNSAEFEENIVELKAFNKFPISEKVKSTKTNLYEITAYTSEVAQCDDSPCITANGFNVCTHGIEDTIAANFLDFGTRVKIPDIYGDRIFVVRDRMNKKYPNRVDVWLKDKDQAIKFGFKLAKLEILK